MLWTLGVLTFTILCSPFSEAADQGFSVCFWLSDCLEVCSGKRAARAGSCSLPARLAAFQAHTQPLGVRRPVGSWGHPLAQGCSASGLGRRRPVCRAFSSLLLFPGSLLAVLSPGGWLVGRPAYWPAVSALSLRLLQAFQSRQLPWGL